MKKIIFILLLLIGYSQIIKAQNVGIGTTSPTEKLHIVGNVLADTLKANLGLQFFSGAGTGKILIGDASGNASWILPGALGLLTSTGTNNYIPKFNPDSLTLINSLLYDNGTGIGIGTTSPTEKLHVEGNVLADTLKANLGLQLLSGAGTGKILISDDTGNASWVSPGALGSLTSTGTNNYVPKFYPDNLTLANSLIYENGTGIGIGTASPNNQLQIGDASDLANYNFAIGNGTQAMAFNQEATASTWYSNNDFSLMPSGANTGYLGIGTNTPAYPLTVNTLPTVSSWGLFHTNGTVQFGDYIYSSGIAGIGTRSAHPLYIFTNNSDAPPAMAIAANGFYVGINTTDPQTHLDIHGANTQIKLSDDVSGNAATISRYTNRLEIGVPDIFQIAMGTVANPSFIIKSNGNIGMGDNSPVNKLQIGTIIGFSGNDLAIGDNGKGMSFYQSATASQWFSNTNFALMPNGGNGFVGIGTVSPGTPLEVKSADGTYGIVHSNASGSIKVGTYVGNNGGWFGTQTNCPLYFFTNNSNAQMTLLQNGNLGLGNVSPANKLQIGAVGNYSGNDIAFGNGTQQSAFAQTSSITVWNSSTNIAIMPQGNGHGRVGINTTTPNAPLEVDDYVTLDNLEYAYYHVGTTCCPVIVNHVESFGSISPQASISAYGNVVASEFDARSDIRIKDIKGISNSARDLATINAIQVTDYTLKDKAKNGDKLFKKVIAQQVETVFPQVVSKYVDFIPNVYQLADKIEKTDNGLLLHFENGHHLSKDAKHVKLLSSAENVMSKYDIVQIVSGKDVIINAPDLKGDKVFVYGEEVNDFRMVDYEGLTTLNISASQELSKLVTAQQQQIDLLKKEIDILKQKLLPKMPVENVTGQ